MAFPIKTLGFVYLIIQFGSNLPVFAKIHCDEVANTETLEISKSGVSGNLLELHIRNNIRGEVEILDGAVGSDQVRIEIEKVGSTWDVVKSVKTNQKLFEVSRGMIYVLQVDYQESDEGLASLIIGSVTGILLFLSLFFLILWWVYRHQRDQTFTPVHSKPDMILEKRQGQSCREQVMQPAGGSESVNRGTMLTAGGAEYTEWVDGDTCTPDSCMSTLSNTKFPPPPPPRRMENYISQGNHVGRSGVGAVGSPAGGMSRATLVSMSIMMVISLVYGGCSLQPRVRVLIYVPLTFQLESIKLFFSTMYKGDVYTDRWSQQNGTSLHVFDVGNAGMTANAPCSAATICRKAHAQDLAGCDAARGRCVCRRGYTLINGLCLDIDECRSDLHACPSAATCQNSIGSYVCRCGYGFYGARGTCEACSVGCPAGRYESKPCTNFGDRSCSDCSLCEGSMYEAHPCQGNTDRQCMHVAHPLLITGQETTPTFLEGLKVEKSANVFTENLHATKNLETSYYATDNTQSTDFFWVRESGLQVHIGIHDAHLIPEYEDITHKSDNTYVEQSPHTHKDFNELKHITDNYCRHPVPDHYTVTVEIASDRITTAKEIVCNSKDPNSIPCPKGYHDGETYLYRTINDACQKMGTFPEALMPATNSIVCTKKTGLLTKIFNETYAQERPIKFLSPDCRSASHRCPQCLDQDRCKMADLFEKQCCQIDCYTYKGCKLAHSPKCTSPPVECAMGNAYRYTIQPNFKLSEEFQCHIKQKPAKILYTLFFHIKVPGPYGQESELETPRKYKVIHASDFDFKGHGEYQADYLSIEHSSILHLEDEFILVGKVADGQGKMNYSVSSLKSEKEFSKRKVVTHMIATNVLVATTQFSRPFAYSTSTWVQDDDCDKDESLFKYQQKLYRNDAQPVSVTLHNNQNGPFKYLLKSQSDPPYIRFMVPGNTSILPWYFSDEPNAKTLFLNESLKVDLELIAAGRIWQIHLKGQMSGCPGYLGIHIFDLIEDEELFHFDTLIFCPVNFNMTFNVPNRGRRADRTFDVRLQDAKKTHHVYLTHMMFESNYYPSQIAKRLDRSPQQNAWAIMGITVSVTLILLLICNFVYVYFEYTKRKGFTSKSSYYMHGEMNHIGNGGKHKRTRSALTSKQYTFVIGYVVFRILYILLFTFTVFLAVLGFLVKDDLHRISDFKAFQRSKYNESNILSLEIERHGQDEMLRQAELVTNMQGACSHYIEELFASMLLQVENITMNLHHHQMYGPSNSISWQMHQRLERLAGRYKNEIDNFTRSYKANFSRDIVPSLNLYKHYLDTINRNAWVQYPQLLFNMSSFRKDRPEVFARSLLTGVSVDFGAFLPIDEVEAVQLWPINFWERYNQTLPRLSSLPRPLIDAGSPQCDSNVTSSLLGQRNLTTAQMMSRVLNSARFMSTQIQEKFVKGPVLRKSDGQSEYPFLYAPDAKPTRKDWLSLDDFISALTLNIIGYILIGLDVLLFLYRVTGTYMTTQTLCQGFEETSLLGNSYYGKKRLSQKAEERRLFEAQDAQMVGTTSPGEKDYTNAGYSSAGMTEFVVAQYESQKRMLPQDSSQNNHLGQNGGTKPFISAEALEEYKTDLHHHPQQGSPLKLLILEALQSPTMPKLVLGMVLMILVAIALEATSTLMSPEVLAEMDVYKIFLSGLDVQVNRTNWYLSEQARHFNQITMAIYRGQMKSELQHFQSMVEYFNIEQERIVQNYINESCLIQRDTAKNLTCDINVTPVKLDIPMVPCNFIPIHPRLYGELERRFSQLQVGADMEPLLEAARRALLKTGYGIIIVCSLMLLIHVIGGALFHFLQSRHKFPVHKTYFTSTQDSAVLHALRHSQLTNSVDPGGAGDDENDSDEEEDDDDEDGEIKSYPKAPHPPKPCGKLKGILSSYQYSETKV